MKAFPGFLFFTFDSFQKKFLWSESHRISTGHSFLQNVKHCPSNFILDTFLEICCLSSSRFVEWHCSKRLLECHSIFDTIRTQKNYLHEIFLEILCKGFICLLSADFLKSFHCFKLFEIISSSPTNKKLTRKTSSICWVKFCNSVLKFEQSNRFNVMQYLP